MNNKSYWERFQELHALIVRAGAICDQIHLHPDSLQALSEEMRPRCISGQDTVTLVTGAVTPAGPVKIASDPNGVVL